MKNFKKFLSLAMLFIAVVLAFEFANGSKIVSKAASAVNKMATPQLNYAYSDSTGKVTVSFSSVTNAKKYRVYRKTANTKWRTLKDTTSTKIVDKTAKKGTTYFYTVRAIRYSKNKALFSSFVKNGIKSKAINPSTPKLKSAKATTAGIKVTWNKTDKTTKYALYRKVNNSSWKRIKTTSVNNFVDKNIKFGKVYYYTVRAIRVFDKIEYYSDYNKTGVACASYYPAKPKIDLAIYKAGGAHITWNEVESASYYSVLRKQIGGVFEEVGVTVGTCYVDDTANDYTAYIYTVQAVNTKYGTPYFSGYDKKGVLMGRIQSDFTLEKITLKLGKPILKWNKYDNAEGYVIYRKRSDASDSTYKLIKNCKSGKSNTYVDIAAASETEYTYVVKPYFADSSNDGLYAIGTVNTGNGEVETNVDPSSTKSPNKDCDKKKCESKKCNKCFNYNDCDKNNDNKNNNDCKNNQNNKNKSNSAQNIMDQIYDDETVNKSVSIIGDSISTYDGYSSGDCYYPTGNVDSSNEMWWKKAANSLGMDICKVNALSGRRLTTTKQGNTSAVERCTNVKDSNGNEPDVIISFIGVNDYINGVELGRYDSSKKALRSATSQNTTKFVDAYCVMINKLRSAYPDAKIILCTLPSGAVNPVNKNGDSLASWNNQIKTIANAFGLNTIRFDKSNFNTSNRASASFDNLHPNAKGQAYLGNRAITDLKNIF